MNRTVTLNRTVSYEVFDCPTCFVDVACPNDFLDNRRKDGRTFYCLNGHVLSYAETEVDRLKNRLAKAEALATSAADQLAAATRERKRQENRAKAGACPCCNRTFVQLARHLKTKHPDFSA